MPSEMWAYLLVRPTVFERVTVPAPQPDQLGDGQVLLRSLAGGICGSDLPYYRGVRPLVPIPGLGDVDRVELPGYPMHEIVGEVVASRHPDTHVGSRVVGWARGMNGLCEYVVSEGHSLAEYDVALPPTTAVLLQPLACVLDAVDQLSVAPGARTAVLGLGPIGLLFGHVLRSAGAGRVTGVDRVWRGDVADTFGIDVAVQAGSDWWARSLAPEDQPELVVEAVGHQVSTLTHAIDAAAPGGQVFYFGIPDDAVYPFPMSTFLRKNLRLTSGTTRDRHGALIRANAYLADHPELLSTYVTTCRPVEQVGAAFAIAAAPAAGRLKVVLDMLEAGSP